MASPLVSPDRIADVLAAGLASIFDDLCVARYGGVVRLRRIDSSSSASSAVSFVLERPGLLRLRAEFSVRHIGGNVYDIQGALDDGTTRSFTYSLPDVPPLRHPLAPYLAHDVATFLLDAAERHLGRRLLREHEDGTPAAAYARHRGQDRTSAAHPRRMSRDE
jgi:hypothetical protein